MNKINEQNLPISCSCPLCGDKSFAQENPNEEYLSIAEFSETCTECFDPYVKLYKCPNEHWFYISYELEDGE